MENRGSIIEIDDFQKKELDVYARLNETQLLHYREPEEGIFIAESPNVILRALNAGYEPISFLVERKHIDTQAGEILNRYPKVPVYTAEYEILSRLTGFELTRGMLAAMNRTKRRSVEEICAQARRIVILDHVMNPTNVGAIFRSAAALGMDAVLLTAGCSDPLYRRASRVSMGTVFQIPWTYLDKSEEAGYLERLRALGFKSVAMALKENSVSIADPWLCEQNKLAIVMGTEGDGLADDIIEACDITVRIPMAHGVDSLNVAAASAVAFWELTK